MGDEGKGTGMTSIGFEFGIAGPLRSCLTIALARSIFSDKITIDRSSHYDMTMANYRIEKDSMGERQIPESAYYGIQTLRAIENFPISGLKPLATYVDACIFIKKAAAIVNGDLGCITPELSQSIVKAADEVLQGNLREQFVVDIYQAGAGTSHHMNVNEVLANRALELLGDIKGNYQRVSPNDHVNYGQSTNDVIPTAIRVGGLLALTHTLYPAIE